MKAHCTISAALAGIGKALEPPGSTMSLKEEIHEVFFFFIDEDKSEKNFHDCYKNWPAITELHCASLQWSKRISHWTELKLQLQNRLQNSIISHERVRSNKKKKVWSRIIQT